MDHASCFYCHETKHIDNFKLGTITKTTQKGKCKSCHNEYVRNYHFTKKIEIYPERYLCCNNCDRIFCKFTHKDKKEVKSCKFCGSEDVERI